MGKNGRLLATLALGFGTAALSVRVLRRRMYTWGADSEEISAVLPGDDLIAPRTPVTTRAVTVDAPAEAVWEWLAQIGEDRGGFYSYAWLQRAVGARIRNADGVHPEWQRLHIGDTVWLAERYGNGGRVVIAAVEPNSHLVLMPPRYYDRLRQGEKAPGAWVLCLRADGDRTRLLARGSGGAIGHLTYDLVHFVMEQKMLRGIRDRAQRSQTGH